MTTPCAQPQSHAPVSVVFCGPTLMYTYQDLQTDFGTIFCTSADFESGMHAAESLAPSILIADQDTLPRVDCGVLRVRFALRSHVRTLVFVQDASEEHLAELLRSGFAGFLQRGDSQDALRSAIDHVVSGEIWAPRRVLSEAFRAMVSVIDDPRFTRRELEILRRIATGQDNREIADGLCITRETVRWHLRSAYSKLGVHDRQIAVDLIRPSA